MTTQTWFFLALGVLNLMMVPVFLWQRDGGEAFDAFATAALLFYIVVLLHDRQLTKQNLRALARLAGRQTEQ